MKKGILIIVIGIAIGYWVGFKDAQAHETDVVTRLVQRVGGENRQHFGNDLDTRLEKLER